MGIAVGDESCQLLTWDSQQAAVCASLSPVLGEAGGGDVVADLPQPASISCNYAVTSARGQQGAIKAF